MAICKDCFAKHEDGADHVCEDYIAKAPEYFEDAFAAWTERTDGRRALADAELDRLNEGKNGADG